ncbi:PAQR family membrane homeostasis protein TrhA [Candidatus Poriferisocius sp.]|uniref:PAQR family membrane homeostasis protein TrhA n=1 Tax=Candidatus Poriferisocius sp. TaxID=3101276 RepID=UPI003B51A1F6
MVSLTVAGPLVIPKPVFRGWSHALAAVAATVLAPIVVTLGPGGADRAIVAVYAIAVVFIFGVSAAYHAGNWTPSVKDIFRRLDHSMIFVFIAASYTPVGFFALGTGSAQLVLGVVWAGAALGVIGRVAWLHAPRWVLVAPYPVVGWAALLVIGEIWANMGVAGATLLFIGGGLYTLGALIYAFRRPDPWPRWFGYHEIFHLLVIAAVALHYVAITFFALPLA